MVGVVIGGMVVFGCDWRALCSLPVVVIGNGISSDTCWIATLSD